MAAAFEGPVEDGLGEVGIMEDGPPSGKRLVGSEEHGLPGQVALVDDLEEDVGRVVGEGEVADLVEDEDVGMEVVVERRLEPSSTGGVGEALDEFGGGGEASLKAVLDGPVGDGDGESGLSGAGRS
jgi:hypothetical protein